LKSEILLLPVSVALSLFRLECASLNNELAVRAQQIYDLYVQFCVNQHRDLVREWENVSSLLPQLHWNKYVQVTTRRSHIQKSLCVISVWWKVILTYFLFKKITQQQ